MQKKTKFAIIGVGYIGKRHAAMIRGNAECELVAWCDILPRTTLGIEHKDIPFFADVESMLDASDADVVVVATPNGLHEKHALQALHAGKHVVIEKPMALTKAGCERILFTALQKQKHVFCVMQNRYSPPSMWLKELVSSGKLGKIFMVQVNCYWNRDDRYYKPNPETGRPSGWHGTQEWDGGTLFTQFSHFVDILYWLFGDIQNIQSRLRDFTHQTTTDFEDSGFVSFDFVQGGMGTLNYSTAVWDQNLESSITIIAEKGSVKVGGQYMNEVEYCHVENYTMPSLPPVNPPNDYGAYKGSAANHHFIIENVVDVLAGNDTITTNALEGMKTVEIIERIYQIS